ncbi:MAG TPA: 50S ribosomal protein L24 [Candidatus Saccharimonadia bacterium]|nr:50S ribosomal protein L24 [Candidatus Saccharimonadia bacterium]
MSMFKMKLKKGDIVIVISGKYKAKTGKVLSTLPLTNQVTVEGINIAKKHVKPTKTNAQGGIIDLIKPINVSKVAIYDPITKKASKISMKVSKEGKKTRIYAGSGKEIK